MALYGKVTEYKAKCADGTHIASLKSIELLPNQENPFGEPQDRFKWIFELADIKDEEGKPVELQVRTSTFFTPKSKAFQTATGILGVQPPNPKTFDIESLVGKRCQVFVKNKTTDRGTFSEIKDVVPIQVQESTEDNDVKIKL